MSDHPVSEALCLLRRIEANLDRMNALLDGFVRQPSPLVTAEARLNLVERTHP